ncbi:MAG: ABC transporter permease [Clostridia bacterium]|nr:ABC transporter permease [Clostridia bacterium]
MDNKNMAMAHIPAEKFQFAQRDANIKDKKLETKPIGYFKDVWIRFRKNKSSVVAAIIILILVLYAILVPMVAENSYTLALRDTTYLNYAKLPPKAPGLEWLGWDGCSDTVINTANYNIYNAIGLETGCNPIREVYETIQTPGARSATYEVKLDSYYKNGMLYLTLTPEQYKALLDYQSETGLQVVYPAVDVSQFALESSKSDANIWYEIDAKGAPAMVNGEYQDLYIRDTKCEHVFTKDITDATTGAVKYADLMCEKCNAMKYESTRIEADDGTLSYAVVTGSSGATAYKVRVFSYNYFIYRYGFEPYFIFGTNGFGQDIFTRLAAGARFSFLLAICVSAINLFIGAVYGAIEGYYGGTIDLVLERVSDILGNVPFMIVATLFQLHLANKVGPVVSLLFAFVLTGWIGMASTVRMQFYRFKGQEYVLAARTLGARDRRLMFKHIFPNSLGTIITGIVLVIPGVIFSESSLTYLGIVNLESSTMTSVGTMLANARTYLSTDPYILLFPALFISLLEISFNLFGNGLRDAFNPSLRGVED